MPFQFLKNSAPYILLLLICPPLFGQETITPGHAFQKALHITHEIELIREHQKVSSTARDPGRQIRKLSLHAFSKTIELLEKIARFNKGQGLPAPAIPPMPFQKISPSDVYNSLLLISDELRKIKKHFAITRNTQEHSFLPGKTFSDIYEQLWIASYLFDGLVDEITPSQVYRNMQKVLMETRSIAQKQNADFQQYNERIFDEKIPHDVLIENYVNMYKIARLQRKLGMEPFYVPALPGGVITPSNVYDTTIMLLAELHRIKLSLGLHSKASDIEPPARKTPADVYGLAILFRQNIDFLIKATQETAQ